MEYIIGFLSAFVFIYFLVQIQNRYDILQERLKFVKSTQSRHHYLFKKNTSLPKKRGINNNTQSAKHDKNINIKVVIMDNQAYWIKDNAFYTANISMNGTVDKDTTRAVDTMGMNRVQLDKMIFIIDRLREGNLNDSGSAGN